MKWLWALGAWEAFWWWRRRNMRAWFFKQARIRADALGKPLIVIGAPDGGVTAGYPCGDITIDIAGSTCPNSMALDITKPLPFGTDSAVIFVACVLEYVEATPAALNATLRELRRVAGDNLFVTRVEPWTITAFTYPGTQRTIDCDGEKCQPK